MMGNSSICPQCGNDFLHGDCGHRNQASVYGTGAGGTLRDDDRIMAVSEAARASEETLLYFVGDTGSEPVGRLLDALKTLDTLEEK